MSGVARKLLGGVLAISLFVCSSLSAFAVDFSNYEIGYYDSSNNLLPLYNSSSSLSGSYSDLISSVMMLRQGVVISPDESSYYYTTNFTFRSSVVIDNFDYLMNAFIYIDEVPSAINYDVLNFDSNLVLVEDGRYVYSIDMTICPDIVSSSQIFLFPHILFYSADGTPLYPDLDNITCSFDLFSSDSSDPMLPFVDEPTADGRGDIEGTIGSDRVSLFLDWDYWVYYYTLHWKYNLGPFFVSLFSPFQSYFESVSSSVVHSFSLLFDRLDEKDDQYSEVTDPAVSEEIQETQQMIDTVEDFESQLHGNITTEFDKIDFTTPTNLAAPVAYVGDKVTRSMNSLGNFQPLIFVPLVLGIMLVMLGRGVSALGHLGSSAARAATRIRSKGGGS